MTLNIKCFFNNMIKAWLTLRLNFQCDKLVYTVKHMMLTQCLFMCKQIKGNLENRLTSDSSKLAVTKSTQLEHAVCRPSYSQYDPWNIDQYFFRVSLYLNTLVRFTGSTRCMCFASLLLLIPHLTILAQQFFYMFFRCWKEEVYWFKVY